MQKFIVSLVFLISLLGFNIQAQPSRLEPAEQKRIVTLKKNYPHHNAEIASLLQHYRTLGKLEEHLHGNTQDSYAQNMLTWQLPTGGFGIQNHQAYLKPWDGQQKRSQWVSEGVEHGNFDDHATVAEIRYLAQIYKQTKNSALRQAIEASVSKAITFIYKAQHPSGGWPQVYPKRTNKKGQYSNHITLNDDAMVRVMVLLTDISAAIAPFDSNIIAPKLKAVIYPKLASAVDYLLKAQIKSQGKLTIWASQHNATTYQPEAGRAYEPIARTGYESVGVITFLINWPWQTPAVRLAINASTDWYQQTKVSDMWHNKKQTGLIEVRQGKRLWYRYYEIEQDVPIFFGRDGVKKYNLSEVESERRSGYGWGGDYAGHLLKAYKVYIHERSDE
ncbi:pectate lyase [Paraglaciecola marina]|uniref:pectate lyase n=1 Tax=Paraglaciecola marina TaxID=2500157 RepID=UPI00105E7646|nr:pectate lyase [Paraglaciecola marina]